MEQTKIYKALLGVRGRHSVDMEALKQLLVRFSNLVVEQPWIKEIDINPLLASENELIALDAGWYYIPPTPNPKIYLNPLFAPILGNISAIGHPKKVWRLRFGFIRPEDEPLMVKFDESLSEESVYLRYAHLVKLSSRVTHERLSRLCFIDYDREMA